MYPFHIHFEKKTKTLCLASISQIFIKYLVLVTISGIRDSDIFDNNFSGYWYSCSDIYIR